MRARIGGLVVAVALALAACDRGRDPVSADASGASREVVATVNGAPVEARDLTRQGDLQRDRRALDLVIARKLAAHEARRRGLDAGADARAELEALRREATAREEEILRDALLAALRDAVPVGDDELRVHYEKTRSRYTERRIRLCRQRFASKEEAEAFDAKLGPNGRLAPSQCEGMGPVAIEGLPGEVIPEALRLQRPGDRATAVREGGASLVELVEILPAAQRSFEEARSEVEESFRTLRAQQAFRAEIERLRRAAAIEIDAAALRSAAPTAERRSASGEAASLLPAPE